MAADDNNPTHPGGRRGTNATPDRQGVGSGKLQGKRTPRATKRLPALPPLPITSGAAPLKVDVVEGGYEWWEKRITLGLAGLAAILAMVGYCHSVRSTSESLALTRDAIDLDNRPWVTVQALTIVEEEAPSDRVLEGCDRLARVAVVTQNTGEVPAVDVSVSIGLNALRHVESKEDLAWTQKQEPLMIPPGRPVEHSHTVVLKCDALTRMSDDDSYRFYVAAEIKYRSAAVRDDLYTTLDCRYGPQMGMLPSLCAGIQHAD